MDKNNRYLFSHSFITDYVTQLLEYAHLSNFIFDG